MTLRRLFVSVAAAALAVSAVSSANAQGASPFAGPYAGVLVGKGWGNIVVKSSAGLNWIAGGFAGYGIQTDAVVVAFEADAMWSSRGTPDWTVPWTAGGRALLGLSWGNFMLYTGVGWTVGRFVYLGSPTTELGISYSAGGQWQATEHLFGRVEFLRGSYGTLQGSGVAAMTHEVRGGWGYSW